MARSVVALALLAACAPPSPSLEHRGTFERAEDWPEFSLRPATSRRGLVARSGEVAIIEGDASLISGFGDALGLRVDDVRNDAAAVTARYAREVGDIDGLLVLFTTFDDRGAGGDAYYLPISNDTRGTGMPQIDQRAVFGAQNFEGFVNLKNLSRHQMLLPLVMHELGHRHLAYATARTEGSTVAIELRGRQLAHWHAALDSNGSLLEGYDWLQNGADRFIIIGRNQRFSSLDRYLLGYAEPAEVEPFFFIRGARTASGAAIPSEAQLPIGSTAFGEKIDLTIDDVIRELGPRAPPRELELHVVFALLTRPDQTATSTQVEADAQTIDALRADVEAEWSQLTGGTLCTTIAPCTMIEPDAGIAADATTKPRPIEEGCDCSATKGTHDAAIFLLLLISGTIRRRCCPSSASK